MSIQADNAFRGRGGRTKSNSRRSIGSRCQLRGLLVRDPETDVIALIVVLDLRLAPIHHRQNQPRQHPRVAENAIHSSILLQGSPVTEIQ